MEQDFLKLFPPELQELIKELYGVILERSLFKAYQNLDEEKKSLMAEIFAGDNERAKENLLKEYLSNLDEIIIEETREVLKEIKPKSI